MFLQEKGPQHDPVPPGRLSRGLGERRQSPHDGESLARRPRSARQCPAITNEVQGFSMEGPRKWMVYIRENPRKKYI